MLVSDKVSVPIMARNVNHYRDKGYSIPMKYSDKTHKEVADFGAEILVDVKDLSQSSHVKIKYKCDNCGEVFETEYCCWVHTKYKELGDLCKSCARQIKQPQSMLDRYGCENSAHVQSSIEKKKRTNLSKYGTEWAIASEQVRKVCADTMMDRYGVENAMKLESTREKAKRTNIERYGVEFVAQSDEMKDRIRQTCLQKYGVSSTAKVKEIREKMRQSLCVNGTVPSSKPEREMCSILSEMYGKESCKPSYPFGELSMDCLVDVGGVLIDFEYDGKYWHSNRAQKDIARNAVIMNAGYRVVRIKANNRDTMPSKQQIQEAVDYLVKGNHHLAFIDMDC